MEALKFKRNNFVFSLVKPFCNWRLEYAIDDGDEINICDLFWPFVVGLLIFIAASLFITFCVIFPIVNAWKYWILVDFGCPGGSDDLETLARIGFVYHMIAIAGLIGMSLAVWIPRYCAKRGWEINHNIDFGKWTGFNLACAGVDKIREKVDGTLFGKMVSAIANKVCIKIKAE